MPFLPLIGHETLRARLEDQITRDALPASLLLHGAAGIGKQRLALWIGQRMLCAGSAPPCGTCQHCRYALEGVHPDLRWFFPRPRFKDDSDPALEDVAHDYAEAIAERAKAHGQYARPDGSNGIFRYVTRLLVQQAVRTPAMASRKVFVIGDAERMVPQAANAEAANAFLRLLEEPPADTTFILTSSEPGALLPTIRSRVVSIRVAPLTETEMRAFLAQPDAEKAATQHAKGASVSELLSLAAGAPGALLRSGNHGLLLDRARTLLDAAQGDRAQQFRVAFSQGGSKARGAFSDVLDAVTVLLHDRARDAVRSGDVARATASVRAVRMVEDAKRAAEGNAMPQLVSAQLMRRLSDLET